MSEVTLVTLSSQLQLLIDSRSAAQIKSGIKVAEQREEDEKQLEVAAGPTPTIPAAPVPAAPVPAAPTAHLAQAAMQGVEVGQVVMPGAPIAPAAPAAPLMPAAPVAPVAPVQQVAVAPQPVYQQPLPGQVIQQPVQQVPVNALPPMQPVAMPSAPQGINPTIDDLYAAFTALVAKCGDEAVAAVLAEFGLTNLGGAQEAQYQALHQRATMLTSE